MQNYYRIKTLKFGMETVQNNISKVLESIDSKVTLAQFMDFNGDTGMLHIQQNRLTIQEKESIN
jgi:hypothetical protein